VTSRRTSTATSFDRHGNSGVDRRSARKSSVDQHRTRCEFEWRTVLAGVSTFERLMSAVAFRKSPICNAHFIVRLAWSWADQFVKGHGFNFQTRQLFVSLHIIMRLYHCLYRSLTLASCTTQAAAHCKVADPGFQPMGKCSRAAVLCMLSLSFFLSFSLSHL